MAVKTYRAKNLFEAFALIRKDFGLNATVLETREIPTRRFFGLFPGEPGVEVVAADETEALEVSAPVEVKKLHGSFSRPSATCTEPHSLFHSEQSTFWDLIRSEETKVQPNEIPFPRFPKLESEERGNSRPNTVKKTGFLFGNDSVNDSLNESLSDSANGFIHKSMNESVNDSSLLFGSGSTFFQQIASLEHETASPAQERFRDAFLQIYAKLQTADMDERSIAELMGRLREDEILYAATGKRTPNVDFAFLERKLQELVAEEIQTAGPIQIQSGKRQTVALVGPTGVGKTTTIAKLAIDYRQKKNCQVGLITLDLSRMGAVEQLQTFADVIGIPMLCASTRRQMRDAIARMADFDLVLIDTAGQSRAHEMPLQEMRVLFRAAEVNDIMLVLSSTARSRVLMKTVEAFAPLGTTSLVLTKLDEALGLGNLFPLLQSTSLPISYLTNGQKVPDDFETAERLRLAKYILGDEVSCKS